MRCPSGRRHTPASRRDLDQAFGRRRKITPMRVTVLVFLRSEKAESWREHSGICQSAGCRRDPYA
jgi:hypothetical protein